MDEVISQKQTKDGLNWIQVQVKGVDREARTMEGWASTVRPDYEGEVILPSAWKESLREWKKVGSRPKFLAYHKHSLDSGHSPVIGGVLKMGLVPEGLDFHAEFAETELGEEHLYLYDKGYMDAFSVGFMPQERTRDPKEIEKLLKKHLPDVDPETVNTVTTKAHILEVSAVVVGMNMGALVKRAMDGDTVAVKALDSLEKDAGIRPDGDWVATVASNESSTIIVDGETFNFTPASVEVTPDGLVWGPENGTEEKQGPKPDEAIKTFMETTTAHYQEIKAEIAEVKRLIGGVEAALVQRAASTPAPKDEKQDVIAAILGDVKQAAKRLKDKAGK